MSKRTRNIKRRRGSNKRSNRRSNKRSNRKSKQLCGSYKKPYWGKDDCICEKGKKSKVHIGTRSEGWACIDHDCKKVKKYFKKPKTGPGHQWFLPIYGIPEKENKIYKNVEYNVFEDVPSKLPKGYKKAKEFPYDKTHIEQNICGSKIDAFKTDLPEGKKGYKHYLIHDNGGRPFAVYISSKHDAVSIYKLPEEFKVIHYDEIRKKDSYKYYSELIKKYKCKDVFIGKSPKNEMTKSSKGYGKGFDGNTILVKLSDKRYIYIGDGIFEFTSLHKIVDYQSPVGNSDVPYPYAIDEKDNYYLMLDSVIIHFKKKEDDPYEKYYNSSLMTKDMSFTPPKEPLHPFFQDIEEFNIVENGKKQMYTLRHNPNPSKEYDRLTKDIGKPLSVKYKDGKDKELSKKDYIKLMKDFGKMLDFKSFKKKLIHKRIW